MQQPIASKLLFLLSLLLLQSACSTNPVTGKNELDLVPESWELDVGKQQYSPSRQSQGGDYVADPAVQQYVNEVGQRLAVVSDRDLPYEFHVLNNSVPNAWALPGGKIAINRGLLIEMRSEAELAAVLGHEIVHAAAKHGAKGMQRGMLLQGGLIMASLAVRDQQYSNFAMMGASIGAQLINTKYGRDAERESDHYGMNYMSRAGYDPTGAVDLQQTFVNLSGDKRADFLSGLFASHPPSQERVENNRLHASNLPAGGEVGKDRYMNKLARLFETEPAYEAYGEAQKALREGQTAKAVELTKKAIAIEPNEGHFYSLLGDIKQKQQNYQSAAGQYEKAISLNNNFFYYYLQYGLVNEKLGNRQLARANLEKSTTLLPTAAAYNTLGNYARTDGQIVKAKEYYALAANSNDAVGKQAYSSLVELDLPANPSQYLKTRYALSAARTLQVRIDNSTPRAVNGIVLAVRYPDKKGRMRQSQNRLNGSLPAGQSVTIDTGIKVNPKYIQSVQTAIIKASLAD